MNTNEIWKDIPNYERLYQVSNLGNVKSLPRLIWNGKGYKKDNGKTLTPSLTKGYYHLRLSGKVFRVHQLVAITFLEHKIDGHKLVVDHINNNSSDNRLENLQIITPRENSSKKTGNFSSKYTGVSWNKKLNKWIAGIYLDGKRKHLGVFSNELDASLCYQNKLKTI